VKKLKRRELKKEIVQVKEIVLRNFDEGSLLNLITNKNSFLKKKIDSKDTLIYWRDDTKFLKIIGFKLMRAKYPLLLELRINYIWRNIPERVSSTHVRKTTLRKLANKDRDIYGYDAQIEVDISSWIKSIIKDKIRLVDRELKRILPLIGEDGIIKKDQSGRTIFTVGSHEMIVETSEEEIKEYGLSKELLDVAKLFREELDKRRTTINRQLLLPIKTTDELIKDIKHLSKNCCWGK
jgi:hypothetical protein